MFVCRAHDAAVAPLAAPPALAFERYIYIFFNGKTKT